MLRIKVTGVMLVSVMIMTGPGSSQPMGDPGLAVQQPRADPAPAPRADAPPGRVEPAAPSQVIEGVISDVETGRPLEGWSVRVLAFKDPARIEVKTGTDATGRYRLTGFDGLIFGINFEPPPGQPYPAGSFQPKEPPRGAPLVLNLKVRRTAFLRGQVIDQVTGLPVAGFLAGLPFPDEPEVVGPPEFARSSRWFAQTDEAGRYELPIPFGRSLVSFTAQDEGHFSAGQGAERLPGYDPRTRRVPIGRRNVSIPVKSSNALVAVEARPGDEVVTLDIRLEPKPEIELTILGPAGDGLATAELQCDGPATRVNTPDASRWVLRDFAADGSTRLTVRHRGRRLAGSMPLSVLEGTRQTLKLIAWGEIRGRVVDARGIPLARTDVVAGPHFSDRPRLEPFEALPRDGGRRITTDAQGQFHVAGLVPGDHYGASVDERDGTIIGDLFDDLAIHSGAILDLGNLVVRRGEPPPPER